MASDHHGGMDRSLAARIGAGRRRPGSPPLPDGVRGAAPLLRLQRAAGNRAVATLARAPTTSTSPPSAAAALTPTGVKPVGDGISTHGAIDRFARKAIWFYQSHGDADLASYGHYLVAAASTELAAVGCPGVQAITGSGLMGALGEFEADVVTAARKLALDRRTPARERTEAADWRDFMVGEDETYVSAVDSWRKDVVAAAVLARDVTRDDATDTRSQIARMLAGWAKEHGPGGYIRSHLASAVKRSRRTLITDIRRIDKALAAAQAALDDLMPHPGKDDFPPLYAALVELARSLSAAYLDQPTEHDAFIAGNAAYDACLRWLRSPRRPLPS